MNSEQDCKSIRQQALSVFSHDFGAISGNFIGYSEFLNRIALKDPSFDDIDIPDLMQSIQEHLQNSTSIFTSTIDYIKSISRNCETIISSIVEQMNTVYHKDFETWYVLYKQLEEHYIKTKQLDTELTHQLLQHAKNIDKLRQNILDELRRL